jgi:UDP-N-acetylmuramate dehydrogenase
MTDLQAFPGVFQGAVSKPVTQDVPLSRFSSFKIGGPADFFFEAGTRDELTAAMTAAARAGVPFYLIGGGYNLLFDDNGYRGLVIRNRAEGIDFREGRLSSLSGTNLAAFLQEALNRGLAGLEFLAGIPGSVGGALFGNAGAFGQCLGDLLEAAVLFRPGEGEKTVGKEALGFGYRSSALKRTREVVLEASVKAEPGDRKASQAKIREYLEYRRTKHPAWGTACAGSYFKNPCSPDKTKVGAGRLLELAGARGLSVGGAAVYEGHCNFIINTGGATARDVLTLAAELKERVSKMFGFTLEEEVIYLPATASTL